MLQFALGDYSNATRILTSSNESSVLITTTIKPIINKDLKDKTLTKTDIVSIILLTTLFLVGTTGNAIVVWIFGWRKRRTRKRFELLLFVLAITDLFASMNVPALFLYGTITKFRQWHFGYYGCKIIMSVFPVTITISQGILILISYERYRSIRNPFSTRISKVFILCWLLATLVAALILVSPNVYAVELRMNIDYGVNTCIPVPEKFNEIYIYSIGNFFRDFAAFSCMVLLGRKTNKSLVVGGGLGGIKAYKKRQENSLKARQMLIVVVCVFSICVIPLDLYQVVVYTIFYMNVEIGLTEFTGIMIANTFLTILQIANSATNIIIYSRMHKDFTKHLMACLQRSKRLASSSFRTTFRSTITSVDDQYAVILASLPVASEEATDNVFLSDGEMSTSNFFTK